MEFRIEDRLGKLAQRLVCEKFDHHVVESEGTSAACCHLDEHFSSGLMQFVHEAFQLGELAFVLIEPQRSDDVFDCSNTRKDQSAIVVGDRLQQFCCFLVEMIRFGPTENRCAAHRCHDDAILDFQVSYFPRREQDFVFLFHQAIPPILHFQYI